MFAHENIINQPVFFLLIAFSVLLTFGYFRGRRLNKSISLSALNDLVEVVRPDDQVFTNIGGAIGYHANLLIKKKGAPLSRVDATITLLPRHSWLYFPVSKLVKKFDRMFVTIYLKKGPSGEGHLIEAKYSKFGRSKITNASGLNKREVKWGEHDFYVFYKNKEMYDRLMEFIRTNPEPGTIRHIAIVPEGKKGFIFMVPAKDSVAKYLRPAYGFIISSGAE
jgi:hypothetical protein